MLSLDFEAAHARELAIGHESLIYLDDGDTFWRIDSEADWSMQEFETPCYPTPLIELQGIPIQQWRLTPNYLSNHKSIEANEIASNLTEAGRPTLLDVIDVIDPSRLSSHTVYFEELKQKDIETIQKWTFVYSDGSIFMSDGEAKHLCL